MQMSLRGFTSKDLRRGTDSINNSYVFLFFALFFSIILLNVTRSCKNSTEKFIIPLHWNAPCLKNWQTWTSIYSKCQGWESSCWSATTSTTTQTTTAPVKSTSGNNKLKNRELQDLVLLRQPLRDSIFILSYTVFLGWVLGFCLPVC